jgi:phosphoserine aminotransferase
LPLEVVEKAQKNMADFDGSGMSVMEMSHRGKDYDKIHSDAEAIFRELLSIPDNYHVLFLGGGASTQFYFIPMNYLGGGTADYVMTGTWAKKAIKEAKLFGSVNVAATSANDDGVCTFIPKQDDLKLTGGAKYFHYTSNNTIFGTEYHYLPDSGGSPLICDMSSDIMSFPFDVSKYDLIYAGAQKNLGPSGATLVIISDEMVQKGADDIPTMVQYRTHADKHSMFNTPPCWNIYVMKLFMDWVKEQGGVKEMDARAQKRSDMVYGAIEEMGDFYKGVAAADSRSRMNITLNLPTPELEAEFIAEALKAEMSGVKGHRSVGGIRFSMYNATRMETAEAVVAFMKDFYTKNK